MPETPANGLLPSPNFPNASDLVVSFRAYLGSIDMTEYDHAHHVRFWETFQRMAPLLKPNQSILELGGMSRIAEFLRDRCGLAVSEYTKDLRESFDLSGETIDLILMLEVLEHLNDRHSSSSSIGEIATFTGSGVNHCLSEAFRVLRPGGCIALTTPNAVAIDVVGRILLKKHPFQYPPHVREYAPGDVEAFARAAGFSVEAFSTFFAWGADPGYSRQDLIETIGSLGYDGSDRGDDAYFVFRKPM